jgi:hypothetical protein
VYGVEVSEIAVKHDQLPLKLAQMLARLVDRFGIPVDPKKPSISQAFENLFCVSASTECGVDVNPVGPDPEEFQDLTGHDRPMDDFGFWILDFGFCIVDFLSTPKLRRGFAIQNLKIQGQNP